MAEPVVIAPGGGEVVADAPDRRVEILCDHDALHATCSRFGPRRDGADLHVHRHHADLFYVLAGELTVRLGAGDRRVAVPAGAFVHVPPLVVHGFGNAADAELRYLNLHAPGRGFADYLRALRDGRTLVYDQEPPPADGGRPPEEATIGAGVDVDDAIAIAETRRDPGALAPPPGDRLYAVYVLEGELALTLGHRRLRATPGTWLHVPPGAPHALAVRGGGPARLVEALVAAGG